MSVLEGGGGEVSGHVPRRKPRKRQQFDLEPTMCFIVAEEIEKSKSLPVLLSVMVVVACIVIDDSDHTRACSTFSTTVVLSFISSSQPLLLERFAVSEGEPQVRARRPRTGERERGFDAHAQCHAAEET